MTTITLDMVRTAAQQIVNRFGADHTNPLLDAADGACAYTNEHGQHCIAGQIFTDLDVYCPKYGVEGNTTWVRVLLDKNPDYEPDAVSFLSIMQNWADEGGTWGDALNRALDIDPGDLSGHAENIEDF